MRGVGNVVCAAAAVLAAWAGVAPAAAAQSETGRPAASYAFEGVVEPRRRVQLSARVDGVVTDVRVAGGERVVAGQVLFEIDPSAYQIAVDVAAAAEAEAAARLALAQDAARRQAALSQRGAGSEARATETTLLARAAEAALARASAERAAAELALSRTKVRAPIAGVAGRPSVAPGAFVEAEAGGVLGEIIELDTVLVAYLVPHDRRLDAMRRSAAPSVAALFEQLTVSLELQSGVAYPHTGKPMFESVAAEEASGALTTWAAFPNPEGLLAPGLRVLVRSRLKEAQPQ